MGGNEYGLNKYLNEQAKVEKVISNFNDDIKVYLADMEDLYFEIRRLANDYGGYDLSDYAKETVNEFLGVGR